MTLQILTIGLLVPATGIAIYYALLAIIALLGRREQAAEDREPEHSFAIVVPAHDEEQGLPAVLESCARLRYPTERVEVVVVADNCLDGTAEVARAHGATCLERRDELQRGKGFALAWAIPQIDERHDAVVVLDADCRIDADALAVFDRHLAQGRRVLQAGYVASNPDSSPMSYAVAVGNLIENDLFYAPKSDLGLAVFLRGTGMVFHRDVLRRRPWDAASVVEDVEYSLALLNEGCEIRFVDEVAVHSAFPVDREQIEVQRSRWSGGGMSLGRKHAIRLILRGLFRGKAILIDAGWTLLVLSRPLVLLLAAAGLVAAVLATRLVPGPLSVDLLILALVNIAIFAAYFCLGILRLGLDAHRLGLLFRTPFVVVRLLAIALIGIVRGERGGWARTPRRP